MSDIEIVPIAYKFKVKKDGIINEFIALKDIPLKEAENKIKDFLEYFKIIAIRKELISKQESKKDEITEYSTSADRFVYLIEFMNKYPEFIKQDYLDFMISKGVKFKNIARANDDFQTLKECGILQIIGYHKWKFIASEDVLKSFLEDRSRKIYKGKVVVQASIPDPKQRAQLMYRNMADKDYFTITDWVEFMTTPPNNYDIERIRNNFYHDIIYLKGKIKEVTMEGVSYKPKRYKILKIEPQEVDERMIKDLKGGQKVLLGTIKD